MFFKFVILLISTYIIIKVEISPERMRKFTLLTNPLVQIYYSNNQYSSIVADTIGGGKPFCPITYDLSNHLHIYAGTGSGPCMRLCIVLVVTLRYCRTVYARARPFRPRGWCDSCPEREDRSPRLTGRRLCDQGTRVPLAV